MSRARRWYRWQRRESTELFALWGVAAATYGVGDVLTTIVMVYLIPGLDEANPFVHWGLETFGIPGLVGLKLGVFGDRAPRELARHPTPRPDHVLFPPVMTCVGLGAIMVNLGLIV